MCFVLDIIAMVTVGLGHAAFAGGTGRLGPGDCSCGAGHGALPAGPRAVPHAGGGSEVRVRGDGCLLVVIACM